MYMPAGYGLYAAAAIKEAVDRIPVFTVGRISDPHQAEKILADGQADMIGMCRAFIADPEFANKAREGRAEEIRQCVSCNQECIGGILQGAISGCIQNPEIGSEKELGIGTWTKATQSKKVLVVGGGRAGLEAARVAALRGHQVVVYEQSDKLGGQVNLASKLPGRDEFESVARWAANEVTRLGVKVILNTEVTPQIVEQEKADTVIVATGSAPLRNGVNSGNPFGIPGAERENVFTVDDVLLGKAELGQKVVVFDTDCRMKGLGICELIADLGKEVELVTTGNPGQYLDPLTWTMLMQRVAAKGVKITGLTALLEIQDKSVVLMNGMSMETYVVDADTVILSTGNKANDDLYFAIKGKVKELYRIGDCVAPRTVDRAVFDGYKVGRSI
jgi:thioredoxin reductase